MVCLQEISHQLYNKRKHLGKLSNLCTWYPKVIFLGSYIFLKHLSETAVIFQGVQVYTFA